MTREQILEILENYKLLIPPTVFYDLKADIVNFEEPTTKNDLGVDCISRADALALYCDKCGLYNCISKCASYRAVEKMPSVTPQEPKTGHWIPSHISGSILDECSECGFACGAFTFNYCPNCGAKMVEPQESEDKE